MKFKKENADEILSLLDEGVEFQGELCFSSGIRVDGKVRGKIRSDACLVIGSKGKVEADVVIRRLLIDGEFHGTVHASERVEIRSEGRVYGDIYTPCLIIEAGALFEGKCNMNDQSTAAAPEAGGAAAASAGRQGD